MLPTWSTSPVARDLGAERLGLGDAHPERLLDEHVLARGQRAVRGVDVELVGDRDHHGVEARIGEHRVVVGERPRRAVGDGHRLEQVAGAVADRVQLAVGGLVDGLEVRRLRDRPRAEHADPQGVTRLHRRNRRRAQARVQRWSQT